jgi:hypothetical protein
MLKMLAVVAVTVALCAPNAADELVAAKVSKLPAIDGKADDDAWKTAKEVVVKIDQPDEESPKKTISVKAVHDGTEICFLLVWADPDKNDQHSPFIWKDPAGYEPDEREGRGRLHAGVRARGQVRQRHEGGHRVEVGRLGVGRRADEPQRLRARPDPRLLAPGARPPVKGRRLTDRDGGQIYFSHPIDAGTPCYTKIELPEKKAAPMLQYPSPEADRLGGGRPGQGRVGEREVDGRVQAQAEHRQQGRHGLRGRQALRHRGRDLRQVGEGRPRRVEGFVLKIQ